MRVGKSRKLKWCSRPDCGTVIHRPGCCCKRRAVCTECSQVTCWKCNEQWHEGRRCGQAQGDGTGDSGTVGIMVHNLNPRVSKCPNCRSPIYKISGCNHMTCYRCNKEYCWVCREITEDYSEHFSPGAIFGCAGMQDIPQSVLLWLVLLSVQLFTTPWIIVGNLSYKLGKVVSTRIHDSSMLAVGFWFGVFGLPFILVPTVIVLPVVVVWRAYKLVMIIVRNFLLCCCC